MPESLDALFDRLEELFGQLDDIPEPYQSVVYQLLDGVHDLHRQALASIIAHQSGHMTELAQSEPAVAWIFRAYGLLPPPSGPTPVQIRTHRRR